MSAAMESIDKFRKRVIVYFRNLFNMRRTQPPPPPKAPTPEAPTPRSLTQTPPAQTPTVPKFETVKFCKMTKWYNGYDDRYSVNYEEEKIDEIIKDIEEKNRRIKENENVNEQVPESVENNEEEERRQDEEDDDEVERYNRHINAYYDRQDDPYYNFFNNGLLNDYPVLRISFRRGSQSGRAISTPDEETEEDDSDESAWMSNLRHSSRFNFKRLRPNARARNSDETDDDSSSSNAESASMHYANTVAVRQLAAETGERRAPIMAPPSTSNTRGRRGEKPRNLRLPGSSTYGEKRY